MSESQNQTAAKLLSNLKKLGNSPEAINQIRQLLRDFPDFIPAWLALGLIYRRSGDRRSAWNTFEKAIELAPNNQNVKLQLSTEQLYHNQFAECRKNIEELLKINPKNIGAMIRLGELHRKEKKRIEALKWFTLAKKQASNSLEAINAELYAIEELRTLGNIEEAVATIKPILQQSPDNIRAKLIYGTLLKLQREFNAGVELYQEIITLKPNNIQAHLELASCLGELGRTQEALEILENAANSSPNNLRVLQTIGNLYRKQQDRQQALKYYQKALALHPQNIAANLNVATELRDLGNLEAAEQQLHQALEYHPHDFNALMQLAQLEQTRQKLDIALEYLQKIIVHHSHRIEPHLKIIDILSNLGRFAEANNNLKILYQKYPEEFRILIHFGYLERRLGQREKALNYFNIAQQKATNPTQKLEAQILAIEELRALGCLDRGIELIEAIIQNFPENIQAKILKGSILTKKAELKEAKNIYTAILSLEPNHLTSRIELAKIYSQLGQIETAISLLEETQQLLGANIHIFLQLGSLNQALDNWGTAAKWYQKACQEYPYNPQGYCSLANLIFLQGETESAIKFLQEVQVKIPHFVQISLKLIEFQLRLGNLDLSHQLLQEALDQFPNNIQLLWQLCRVNMDRGNYDVALDILNSISTDNRDWIRQTEQLRANIYFYQYDYHKAEEHLKQAISSAPIATGERNRLATILMLTGRIEEARQELKIATEELHRKTSPGKITVPLKSHPAMVTNELRMNPPLMTKLQAAQKETGIARILALGSLLTQNPIYLGAALYLAREFRAQGIFDNLQQALAQNSTSLPAIPKRIVQFWDEPEPPPEVQRICQSWRDYNPEYEYIRFSLETAVAFLKEHYNQKVLNAFANCEQPATQADFFRLAYLNKMGGFYADADDLCRQSLNNIINLNPELVVLQEDFACIGNNFLGCIPGQSMIRTAFYQAVDNLSYYCNEAPWFKTGPALITSAVCSGLLPYLTYTDYQVWPRLLVLTQAQLRKIINQHLSLPYKRTAKSWQQNAYQRRIKVLVD